MTRLDELEFRRILLIKPSSLGDIVHALPILHGLRVRYPGAHIAWLVARDFRGFLEHHPELDQVIEFDRRRLGRAYYSPGAALDLLRFLRRLRAPRFDLVVDLQGLLRSGIFARATGARVRIGAGRIREGATWFYTVQTPTPTDSTHAVDANWEVARILGFERAGIRFDLAITPEERLRVRQQLSAAGVKLDRPFLAVLPGARWETKRWIPRQFVELINSLHAKGRQVVLMGAGSEAVLCREIAAACESTPVNLAGQTGIRELCAVLDQAAHVICNDSAPMHIAAALGRPLTAMFGPTNTQRTGPYSPQARIARLSLDCSPCYLRTLAECPHRHRCMTDLPVGTILDTLP